LRDYRKIRRSKEEPDQLGAAQWAFGDWRPDLIDFWENEIFEIKPVRTAHYGVLQLWRYTHNFNCALYFDWLTKPGAQDRDIPQPLRLGRPSDHCFREVDPSTFMEEYFRSRDEKDEENESGAGQRPRIPKQRQRARQSEIESVLRARGKIKVVPMLVPPIPGLVLYLVHSDKPDDDDKPKRPPRGGVLPKVAIVVTGVLVIAAVFVGIVMATAALAEGAAAAESSALALSEGGALLSSAAVALPESASTSGTVLEAFGEPIDSKTAEASIAQMSKSLSQLNSENLL
jgi:hypothetical protein